ncbi:hypothetical protein BTJ48_03332 [Bacillus mycoides]|nr:hypothetical protein BTJ48_03332 [Bacillus mycoides]
MKLLGINAALVAPLIGAGIEITYNRWERICGCVAPIRGAGIEIQMNT